MDVDFTKVFDKVPHKHLFTKLTYCGIQWSRLPRFSYNRSQQVILDGSLIDSQAVTMVVPQGTVYGPLLLLCFVNNIPKMSPVLIC